MALSITEKNLLIASAERALIDAKDAAGISALSEIETAVTALRAAYVSNPDNVSASDIVTAIDMLQNLKVPSLTSMSDVIIEARAEAAE